MCVALVAVISIIISVVNTVIQTEQANANARATERHAEAVHDVNKAVAEDDAKNASIALSARSDQDREVANASVSNVVRQSLRQQGAALTQAGAGGVQGSSVGALLGEFQRQELEHQTSTARQIRARNLQLSLESQGIASQSASRILSTQPGPVPRPGALGSALGGVGAAVSGAADFNTVINS